MRLEPGFGAVRLRTGAVKQVPVPRRMIEVDEMGDLVRRQIVEHEGRGEDKTPGEAEPAAGGAGAPAAHRVADRYPLGLDPDGLRVARHRSLDVLARLPDEKIRDAAGHMRALPRHADQGPVGGLFEPHAATRAGP